MVAEYIRIAPGQRWIATAPRGSDCYLFMLDGTSDGLRVADGASSASFLEFHIPADYSTVRGQG